MFFTNLIKIENDMKNTGITNNIELNNFSKRRFGDKFIGVFMSDQIPKLKNNQSCIINTEDSKKNGEHWIALINLKNVIYSYDSFARDITKLSKHFDDKWIQSNKNVEQSVHEYNCGQNCISWIDLMYQFNDFYLYV